MLMRKLWTKNYKHDYFFEFKGEQYRVHSIVRLTDKGKSYLGSWDREVILVEQFTNWDGVLCWKYEFKSIKPASGVTNVSTDVPPNQLIEEVVIPVTADYASRELYGVDSPIYETGIKHRKKDWEIPEVRTGWIVLIAIFIGVSIFKDRVIQLVIRCVAGWIFGLYRQRYVDAYTTYTYDEDAEILKKKYEVLYGIKFNKEDNTNE